MKWTGKKDDQTLIHGDYILRAEEMNESHVWWCVYYKGEQVYSESSTGKYAETMTRAKFFTIYYLTQHQNILKLEE